MFTRYLMDYSRIIFNGYYKTSIKMNAVMFGYARFFRAEIIIRQAIILSHRGVDHKLYYKNAAANIVIIFCMD